MYDAGGKKVTSGTAAMSTLFVNLSGQISGTYHLKISINGKQQSWKIIKK